MTTIHKEAQVTRDGTKSRQRERNASYNNRSGKERTTLHTPRVHKLQNIGYGGASATRAAAISTARYSSFPPHIYVSRVGIRAPYRCLSPYALANTGCGVGAC